MGAPIDERELRALTARVASRLLARGTTAGPAAPTGAVHVSLDGARPGARGTGAASLPASNTAPTPLEAEEAWLRSRAADRTSAAAGLGPFRVAVACDHGGYDGKPQVLAWLARHGHAALDLGTHDATPVDYPVFAERAAREVQSGRCDLAVVLDGAGVGSAMAASRLEGVRAANGATVQLARNAREHNYANVLTLGTRLLDADQIDAVLAAFFETPWGEARHGRRVALIEALRSSS